jgi:hypothetical protein
MLRALFIYFPLLLLIAACADNKEEQRLRNWEQSLQNRELEWSLKEADYQSLIKMRDSILTHKDTVVAAQVWPESVMGEWKSNMRCNESNCSNYVIGDKRSERWEFGADSVGLFVKAFNDTKLVRIFSGRIEQEKIYLHFKTDSTSSKKADIQVVLDKIDQHTINGTQTISGDNDCTARFSVDLTRTPKN